MWGTANASHTLVERPELLGETIPAIEPQQGDAPQALLVRLAA
jgi:hypothetical protein